jgi:hypothetical protein
MKMLTHFHRVGKVGLAYWTLLSFGVLVGTAIGWVIIQVATLSIAAVYILAVAVVLLEVFLYLRRRS